jgi:hypothetical protein
MAKQNEQVRGTHFLEGTKGGTSQTAKKSKIRYSPTAGTKRGANEDSETKRLDKGLTS